MTKILEYITLFIVKHNKKIVLLWVVSLIISIAFLFNRHTDSNEDELSGAVGTEAYNVEQIVKNDFQLSQESSLGIVIEGKDSDESLKNSLIKSFPEFADINEIKGNKDHKNQFYYIRFKPEVKVRIAQSISGKVRAKIRDWEKEKKVKAYLTGDSAFFYDVSNSSKKDTSKNEKIALIASFLILIRTFGGFLSAFIPILAGVTTIVYINIALSLTGLQSNTVSLVLNSLIGLGLAIDYSLFIISRFREEKDHHNIEEAIKISMVNSGKTIFFSALIMIVSVSALLIPDVSSTKMVVRNIMIVVSTSCFVSIFILPTLSIFGKNFLDKPKFISDFIKKRDSYTFWKKYATHITDYPKTYFLISALALGLISYPALSMKLWEPLQAMTPKESESRIGYEILQKDGWGGELLPIIIAVKSDELAYSLKNISVVYDLTKYLQKNKQISDVLSLTSLNKDMSKKSYQDFYTTAYSSGMLLFNQQVSSIVSTKSDSKKSLVFVYVKDLMDLSNATEIVKYCRAFQNPEKTVSVSVGGVIARAKDYTNELYRPTKLILSIVFIGIFFILLFYMKTPILPIKASIMNFLPIISAFGVLTAVFQYGYFSSILGTANNGAVTTMVPVVLFCIIFGLGMDYEVLILSRITENYKKTGNVKQSVIEGIAKSSSVITGAGLILLSVFIPGIFSSSALVQEICIGITSAILIDTTIVRLVLVPSFMMLMGKWNWWNPFK